ncbi:unnamed protein product, partial [Polarella glacialis]
VRMDGKPKFVNVNPTRYRASVTMTSKMERLSPSRSVGSPSEAMSTGMPADEDLMARHQRTNAEAKKWREAAETAISEATVLGAELEALRRRHDYLRKRKEAREERHHHDALSLAASQAAEAVKVRLTNQEAMARARAERRRLQ